MSKCQILKTSKCQSFDQIVNFNYNNILHNAKCYYVKISKYPQFETNNYINKTNITKIQNDIMEYRIKTNEQNISTFASYKTLIFAHNLMSHVLYKTNIIFFEIFSSSFSNFNLQHFFLQHSHFTVMQYAQNTN